MGERWNDKLRKFRAKLVEFGKAHPPEPVRPKRASGPIPRVVPSDWYDPERQEFLGPQCEECHHNIPVGCELVAGKWCGACGKRHGVYLFETPEPKDLPAA